MPVNQRRPGDRGKRLSTYVRAQHATRIALCAVMMSGAVAIEGHAQKAPPTLSGVDETSGSQARPPSESRPVDASPEAPAPSAARNDEAPPGGCQPARVVRLFAGRTFELDQPCPASPATLALRAAPTQPQPSGWGSLIPGQPGLGLLRHGWVAVGDLAQPSPTGLPASVRDALQLPEPTEDVVHREYRVEPQAVQNSLRIPLAEGERATVPALRMPAGKPVRLRVPYLHRYLDPGQVDSATAVQITVPYRRLSPFAGIAPLLGGAAGVAIGAGLLSADARQEFPGWLPSLEGIAGQFLLITGSAALVGGITLLMIRAADRYPAEQ